MKCHVCGYEKRTKYVKTATVTKYTRGSRKGEIKEVKEKTIDVFEDDPKFIKLIIGYDDITVRRDNARNSVVDIYACPMCGTLRLDELY